jgi:hypothetical protein
MGTIPVLLRKGGVTDIVEHGKNGFLGDDLKQVAESTIAAFSIPIEDQLKLRLTALETVVKFEDKAFIDKFRVLAHRGKLTKPFRHLIKETSGMLYTAHKRHTYRQRIILSLLKLFPLIPLLALQI